MSRHRNLAAALRLVVTGLLVLGASAPAVAPAAASDGRVVRRGSCSGPSEWKLDVRKEDGGKLRVKYEVEGGKANQRWHVFISDNGTGIFAGSRTSGSNGHFEVTRFTANRPGTDRIRSGSNNTVTGETCNGLAKL